MAHHMEWDGWHGNYLLGTSPLGVFTNNLCRPPRDLTFTARMGGTTYSQQKEEPV